MSSHTHAVCTTLLQRAVLDPGAISEVYRQFHSFSLGNQLLAMSQCHARGIAPGPMATYPRWQELGRQVRKGEKALAGTDAPICQDTRSGSQVCGLARSVVCHHALKDFAGEKAFETADDLPCGPPFSGASFDVVEGW